MKKIVLAMFLLMTGSMNVRASCSEIEKHSLNVALTNVSFNYTIMPNGSSVFTYGNLYDVSNKVKITATNLPDEYTVYFQSSESVFERMNNYKPVYLNGGVYKVSFQNSKCGSDTIKAYYVMVPYFNDKNEDVWFDGTYETKKTSTLPTAKKKPSIVLIISVLLLIALLTALIIIPTKKRRNPQL